MRALGSSRSRSAADTAEFEKFVLDHGTELLAFARRLTMDHHRAEDILQDVLARMALAWPEVRTVDDLRAYVFKSVLNQFLSWRRRMSSGELPVSMLGPASDPSVDDLGSERAAPGFDDAVAERDLVRRALAKLSPPQRAVLVLRFYHDKSDAAIAELMGCREGTVRSHARRGLERLRSSRLDRHPEGAPR